MSIPGIPTFGDALFLLSSTFGAGLVGSWMGVCLYGLTTTQTYVYLLNYPKDSPWIKLLVFFLWVINTAHTICLCHLCYHYMITALLSLDFNLLLHSVWSLPIAILLRGVVSVTVMLYYVNMIFRLSSRQVRWWLTGVLVLPIVLYFAFALDTSVRMLLSEELTGIFEFVHSTILPGLIMQVIADGSITVSLCVILYKKRTEFKGTRKLINALMIYAVSRGMITLVAALIMVLILALRPNEMWYIGVEFAIVGLYTNSLMTILNTRQSSSEIVETTPTINVNSGPQFRVGFPGGRTRNGVHVADRATNVEFISLAAKTTTSYNDSNKEVEVMPVA